MNSDFRKPIIVGASLIVLLVGAFYYTTYKKQHYVRTLPLYGIDTILSNGKTPDTIWHQVSNFHFTDQNGQPITQQNLTGSVYVADYIFTTCPGICKDMSREMERVYAAYADNAEVKIVSHTSKPEEDSVSVLKDYAVRHGVKDHQKWLFLTGNIDSLYKMAVKDYFIVDDVHEESSNFVHTERFVLIDKQKHIRGYYDGTNPVDVDRLIKDISHLLKEPQQ